MEKRTTYASTFFADHVLRAAEQSLRSVAGNGEDPNYLNLSVQVGDDTWRHDSVLEFWADYRRSSESIYFFVQLGTSPEYKLQVDVTGISNNRATEVMVAAPDRSAIESVFQSFEDQRDASKLPEVALPEKTKVFIGHGRSPLWLELKDHLQDSHGYSVEAYEIGARAGHAVRDVLEKMLDESCLAFLVMTGEDEANEDELRARQNVVHELGLFQGRLGFSRAIAVVEHGTILFSNIEGIQQIRFSQGNIREALETS